MKRLQDFIVGDQEIFGPGTDLVVSLVAILIILLVANTSSYQQEVQRLGVEINETEGEYEKLREQNEDDLLDIKRVRDNQMEILHEIAARYGEKPKPIGDNSNKYRILIRKPVQNNIIIENNATLQHISFGSHILFDENDIKLKDVGEDVLRVIGNIFKDKLNVIKEVQIQGHADPQPTNKHGSNLRLAALRAIEVFKFLQKDLKIDPTRHLMSATSFGEYKPVQRTDTDMDYDDEKLKLNNDTHAKRELNRRIEIVLIYRKKDEFPPGF